MAPEIQLSAIVPVYNEAERLPKTLQRLHAYLAAGRLTYEIVVVLDGPTDATAEVLRRMSREIGHLKIIDRAENRGKGYTVKQGMLRAAGEIRLFTDADNSTDIRHFDQMMPLFDQGCDLVIASRNPKDAPEAEQAVPQAAFKRAIGQLGNRIVQSLAVPGIWDTQCGFKAFRSEAAERIFTQTRVDRWGFDIEVLALAQALNYQIGIIPARWVNDERSHVRLTDYFRVLADTVQVWRNLRKGQYRV
ncbi:MAG TPA: dolichyl-phosphate beta-glucosyltransferase [Verrucomicrobiae bacterium]|nr:dolichyl-phosphate beta-glucosyltransferase [Verrucomicrobiae bacterium]